MFRKLKIKHNYQNQKAIERTAFYGQDTSIGFFGLQQFKAVKETEQSILKFIPKKHRSLFEVHYLLINYPLLIPHTDDRPVTINFYIDTASAITKFYKSKSNCKTETIRLSTFYDFEDIEEVSSFIAESGDVFIINTHEIHNVLCQRLSNRTAYCLETKHLNYDQVLGILEEENLV